MRYWMKFIDNSNEIMYPVSDTGFTGKPLSIPELKERFNSDFVKGTAKAVEISFLGKGVNHTFIAGIRNKSVVICDTKTKREFTPKEFSEELNIIERAIAGSIPAGLPA